MVIDIKGVKSGEDSLTSTRRTNGIWRCPSIDINARSRDCHANDAQSNKCMKAQMKLSGVCIQLAYS